MAKLISLRNWIFIGIFLFVAAEIAIALIISCAVSQWPFLQQYSEGLYGFFSTRILALTVWGIIAGVLYFWKAIWRLPVLGTYLSKSLFPVLHGEWQFTVDSNWPVIEKLKNSAAATDQSFDVLAEDEPLPSYSSFTFRTKITQTWFSTKVEFIGDEGSVLDHSMTLSVELLQETETDPKRVVWVYRQHNKQGFGKPLSLTDEAQFYGAAVMRVCDDGKLKGHYWTNRSWQRGLNAAGEISGNRKP